MDFSPILKREDCASCKVCCVFKPESLVYVPKGVEVKQREDGVFVCVHRCRSFGCTLGKNKPMECAAWPFSVSKCGSELLLVLEHSCPELNKKEKAEDVKKFAWETVAPVLMEYSKQHLDTLREYDKKNTVIGLSCYPYSTPISLYSKEQIQSIVLKSKTNISGFAFANLYLFRNKYNFNVSLLENDLLITGAYKGKTFFSILGKVPQKEVLAELLGKYDYWKGISEEQAAEFNAVEDRDNFEYIYARTDLAELPGRIFQKKRNLVNAFVKTYSEKGIEQKILDKESVKDAQRVLDEWRQSRGLSADYNFAKEALEQHEVLGFKGMVFYVGGYPVGYCQGEVLADEKSFAVHFEKALDKYKGVYQYINQKFAKSLPENINYINREQDLGNSGLRQAKMTYNPIGFVKLFSSNVSTNAE